MSLPLVLSVPAPVHGKLTEIAGSQSPEEWARNVLIRAMEEAQPSLRTSGLWNLHKSSWYDQDTKEGD